jgi:hypothetical protein
MRLAPVFARADPSTTQEENSIMLDCTLAIFDERLAMVGIGEREATMAKQKWGPALLPAPTCTELRICRCSLA